MQVTQHSYSTEPSRAPTPAGHTAIRITASVLGTSPSHLQQPQQSSMTHSFSSLHPTPHEPSGLCLLNIFRIQPLTIACPPPPPTSANVTAHPTDSHLVSLIHPHRPTVQSQEDSQMLHIWLIIQSLFMPRLRLNPPRASYPPQVRGQGLRVAWTLQDLPCYPSEWCPPLTRLQPHWPPTCSSLWPQDLCTYTFPC